MGRLSRVDRRRYTRFLSTTAGMASGTISVPRLRRRPPQRRQFRAVLDADADRTDLELRVISAAGRNFRALRGIMLRRLLTSSPVFVIVPQPHRQSMLAVR